MPNLQSLFINDSRGKNLATDTQTTPVFFLQWISFMKSAKRLVIGVSKIQKQCLSSSVIHISRFDLEEQEIRGCYIAPYACRWCFNMWPSHARHCWAWGWVQLWPSLLSLWASCPRLWRRACWRASLSIWPFWKSAKALAFWRHPESLILLYDRR